MTEEIQRGTKRRKAGNNRKNLKKSKKNKKIRALGSNGNAEENFKVNKMDKKMKKMFQKRARDYNSDDDVEDDAEEKLQMLNNDRRGRVGVELSDNEDEGEEVRDEKNEISEDEDDEIQPGIMRFVEGCKAFRLAFKKITKRSDVDTLGPILSAHKKLVAEKLAEEEAEHKSKGVAKKEKHIVAETGHVKPANYLDSHEKSLIQVATKGVVKLFNAVNKAQHAQKGLNPSRAKDEKAIRRQRKEAFFSELRKKSSQRSGSMAKVGQSTEDGGDGPAWAPLRDNYMLTNSKLKDWDKMADTTVGDDFGLTPDTESLSDDD